MHTLVGPDSGSVMSLMYEQSSEHRDVHAFCSPSGARSPFCSTGFLRENESVRKELHGCFQHTLLRGPGNITALNGTKRHRPFASSFASRA